MKNMWHHKKDGVSSVVGMLIVTAMFFTVIIPLFIYVNEVNTAYNTESDRMDRFDHEKSIEKLSVVAYPVENGSELNIYVYNGASITTEVVREWVTDVYNQTTRMYNISENESIVSPASDVIIHNYRHLKFRRSETTES